MKRRRYQLLSVLLATLLSVSCQSGGGGGGDSGVASGGIGGTGVTSSGTITGFGSVFVTENEFEVEGISGYSFLFTVPEDGGPASEFVLITPGGVFTASRKPEQEEE